jgi:hypothetical protein
MATKQQPAPLPGQWEAAALHLARRSEWIDVRISGVRYVVLVSGTSGRIYTVRADARGCLCKFYQSGGRRCSHMLAVELAALEDELAEQASAAAPKPRATYDDLFAACPCGDLADGQDGMCSRCASDREWQQRTDAARQYFTVRAGE